MLSESPCFDKLSMTGTRHPDWDTSPRLGHVTLSLSKGELAASFILRQLKHDGDRKKKPLRRRNGFSSGDAPLLG
jgi:hypothetical protein